MIIEVHGVEVFGHHGVNEDERNHGQTFLVDVWLTTPDASGDVIAATIDYRRVRDIVHAVNDSGAFQLLETFAAAVADSVREQLLPDLVRVRVRKPGVAWAEWTAVTVERS
jgi:dihydroneopterin aldolase